MNQHISTQAIVLQILNATLGSFYFGYSLGVLNFAYPTIQRVLGITENRDNVRGFLNAMVPLGATIGAVSSGFLLQKFSRRQAMMVTDIIGIVSCLISAFPVVITMSIARLGAGIVTGLNSALVPLYIREMSPIQISGMTGSMNQTLINFGTLFSYILGLGFPSETVYAEKQQGDLIISSYWRFVLMFPVITCLCRIYFLKYVYIFETPIYYAQQNDLDQAQLALQNIYQKEFLKQQMAEVQKELQIKSKTNLTFLDMFQGKYRKRTLMAIRLMIIQQFSGSNAVVIYSKEIFLGMTTESMAVLLAILVGVVQTVSAIFSGAVTQIAGRQFILLVGEVVMVFSLFLLWIFTNQQSNAGSGYEIDLVILIFLYNIAFNASLGPVIWLYIAQILPEQGVSIGALFNWACVVVIAQSFPSLVGSIGIANIFLLFGAFCFLGFFYVKLELQETKDLQPHQIDQLFEENESEPLLGSNEMMKISPQSQSKANQNLV